MIILGNKFDGIHYEIEDTKTNEKITITLKDLLKHLKKDNI